MLSKCANPECTKPFLYLCQGKLFRFEVEQDDPPPAAQDPGRTFMRIHRRTEYFWLCESCAKRMTVAYQKGKGVTTLLFPTYRAAS
jgi:hypothetical protein